MLLIQLVGSLVALAMDQLIQTRYGPLAVVGLFLLGVGIRARSVKCAGIGAALLMLGVNAPQA